MVNGEWSIIGLFTNHHSTLTNMASKRTIKRIVLTTVWTAITGGVLTLLVAANSKEQKHTCRDVLITIKGTGERYYISKGDIARVLRPNGEPTLRGQATDQLDLALLERRLEANAWIQEAEMYFDRSNDLHVVVTERQPIARVFTKNGSSFYIDSSGARLPLLSHISARVPVVTNYPSARKPLAKDSAVMQDVRQVVQYISTNDFWNAQIAQIDVTPLGSFELLPTVGNHIIRLGKAENIGEKLDKLLLMYKQVMSKTGFDKYSMLDIQYAGQVVAVHRGENTSVDSAQLKQNIASLLRADQMMQGHTAAEATAEKGEPAEEKEPEAPKPAVEPKAEKPKPSAARVVKAPEKKKVERTEQKNKGKAATQQKPKAVMPKRNG